MPKGLSKIADINRENAAKKAAYEAGGGNFRYFTLQDGESTTVRFLEQGDDVEFFFMHALPQQPGEAFPKRTPCLDQDNKGVACPACERAVKRSTQIAINLIWYDAPAFQRGADNKIVKGADNKPIMAGTADQNAVWKTGPENGGRLEYLNSEHGGLIPHIFKIKRQGATKDDTKYMIDIVDKNRVPTPAEMELITKKYKLAEVMKAMSYGDMARVYSGGSVNSTPANGQQPATQAGENNAFADAAASPINRGAFS